MRHAGNHVRHREKEHRQRERRADPKTAGHVAQFAIVFRLRRYRLRFQGHPTFRARAGMILLDFRVHRAGVNHLRACGLRGRGFQGHAALRASARHVALHAGAHRAKVFRLRGWNDFRGSAVPAAATRVLAHSGRHRGFDKRQRVRLEFSQTMRGAEIVSRAVVLGFSGGGISGHFHAADGIEEGCGSYLGIHGRAHFRNRENAVRS